MESRLIHFANYNGVMDDIIPLIRSSSLEEAEVLLLWQDVSSAYAQVIDFAKSQGKEIILMTHCYASCNDYLPPHSHLSLADKVLVWGMADYSLALQAGIAHKTIITGTPIFSHKKERQKQDKLTVVFCPSRNESAVETNKQVTEALSKLDAHVFTKLTREQEGFLNPVVTKQGEMRHVDVCFDLISKADVVVVTDPTSTFALFAFSCDVPVIYVPSEHNYYYLNNFLLSGQYQCAPDELEKTITEVLEKDTLHNQRMLWADYCGAFINNPIESILKEL